MFVTALYHKPPFGPDVLLMIPFPYACQEGCYRAVSDYPR